MAKSVSRYSLLKLYALNDNDLGLGGAGAKPLGLLVLG
jgi:hypothetical protein